MDQNFTFRWIWRINSVLLLAALVALWIALTPEVARFIRTQTGSGSGYTIYAPLSGKTTATPTAGNPYDLFLDYARPGRREAVMILAPALQVTNEGGGVIEETQPNLSRVANYLFIDPTTGGTHWLFPTNKQIILATDYVYGSTPPDPYTAVVAPHLQTAPIQTVLYDVQPERDATAAASSKFQLYASKLDGSHLTKLLDDLDEPAKDVSDGTTVVVRYLSRGHLMLTSFSVADFKLLTTKDVTDLARK